MDDATLTLLEKSAYSGVAHPFDVLVLCREVRRLQSHAPIAFHFPTPTPEQYKEIVACVEKYTAGSMLTVPTTGKTVTEPSGGCWGEGSDPSPLINRTLKAMAEQIRKDSEAAPTPQFLTFSELLKSTTSKTADELRAELGYAPPRDMNKYPGESNTFIPFENAEAAQALVDRLKAGEILWGPLIPVYHYDSKGTVMMTQPDPQSFSKSSDEPTIVEGK